MTRVSAFRNMFTLLALAAVASVTLAQDGPQKLAAVKLSAGMHVMNVEVAQSPQEHSIGLMFRKTMPTNDGMLFIFDRPGQQCFWMKNTLLPLSIAFITDDGSISNNQIHLLLNPQPPPLSQPKSKPITHTPRAHSAPPHLFLGNQLRASKPNPIQSNPIHAASCIQPRSVDYVGKENSASSSSSVSPDIECFWPVLGRACETGYRHGHGIGGGGGRISTRRQWQRLDFTLAGEGDGTGWE